MKSRIKNMGGIYTPKYIVNYMLDLLDYNNINILNKNIMENSCGDGAFLCEIVARYCEQFLKIANLSRNQLKLELEQHIFGIEKDETEHKKCLENLGKVAEKFDIFNVKWNVICGDSLEHNEFDGKMDFVVGNPPYVRVHNLENYNNVKKLQFTKSGMTDLYIAFFEIGFNQLKENGKMCLITPNSFLTSKSGIMLRKYIQESKKLKFVVDCGLDSLFGDIATYPIITLFLGKSDSIFYKQFSDSDFSELKYDSVFGNGKMSFDNVENLELLNDIEKFYRSQRDRDIIVKNGFATLADKVFIGDFDNSDCTIDILKASTGQWNKCIFPYVFPGVPIKESTLGNYKQEYEYLIKNKELLESRDYDKNSEWFLFGRSQGIKDVYKNKIAINTIIKEIDSIKINEVGVGKGVYSGLYILSKYTITEIKTVILSEDFIKYIKMLKKYKSGGYYTFSSLELEKYLVYKLKYGDKDVTIKLELFA